MLYVIQASEVREGEPRLFFEDLTAARNAIDLHGEARIGQLLHLAAHSTFHWCPVAIVSRPDGDSAPVSTPPASDAERRFWESSCTAALSSLTAKVGDLFSSGAEFRECATRAADIADAALDEWRKRWGAK